MAGRTEDSLNAFIRSVEKSPSFLKGHLRLGRALAERGFVAEARQRWHLVVDEAGPQTRTGTHITDCAEIASAFLETYPSPGK